MTPDKEGSPGLGTATVMPFALCGGLHFTPSSHGLSQKGSSHDHLPLLLWEGENHHPNPSACPHVLPIAPPP